LYNGIKTLMKKSVHLVGFFFHMYITMYGSENIKLQKYVSST